MATSLLQDLQDERVGIGKKIQELAKMEPSEFNAERQEEWDALNPKYDELTERIDSELRSRELAAKRLARLEQITDKVKDNGPESRATSMAGRMEFTAEVIQQRDEQRALALQGWLRAGSGRHPVSEQHRFSAETVGLDLRENAFDVRLMTGDNVRGHRAWNRGHSLLRAEFNTWLESRQNLAGTDNVGGYSIPVGFQRELERALLDFGGMRRVARVWATSGSNPIQWPTTTDVSNKASLIAEATTNETTLADVTFGQVVFDAFKYTSLIQASAELLEDSAFNLASVFGSMLGERLGRGTAEHYATGDGTAKPTGVTIGAAEGPTTASATAVTFDEIIDLIHSVDPSYRRFSSFGMVFNDSTLQALRKLKDSQGRYLWEPSLQVGEPDRIFGVPYIIDQDMPSIASTARPIVCGAMEKFVIRDHANVRFYRLEERYRELDLTGFSIFFRTDSHVVDAGTNPIKYLLCAT